MPLHALVTLGSAGPWATLALAREGVTRVRERPPGVALTLLAAAARRPRIAMETGGTPTGVMGVGGGVRRVREHGECSP